MRRWGIVSLIGISAFVAPIVSAAPAHAACAVYFFGRCISSGTSPPTTAPPAPTPPPPAPTPTPPAPPAPTPPPPSAIDPNDAAAQFFDLTNGARANGGVAALQWRADVASMAVSHSVEMAQAGTIWHGSFVSQGNLAALNASSLGENVGMGGDVASIQDAFMNSPHHLENIMDPAFNQVGVGIIVSGGTVYVTLDFLHSKSPGTARPTPVAHPTVSKPSAPHASSPKVASGPPRHATTAAGPAAVSAAAPVTTPPSTPAPEGIVTAVPFDAAPAAAAPAAAGVLSDVVDGGTAVWAAMFGVLLLVGAASGHVVIRRRSA
ncbi:MAG: CAP domain-containing protein [Actinobacteria bacterium]|nr:MAG: CAP domain-containing protein [Actinomycetota bacterium]